MNRTNVKTKPKKDSNACHDFFELVTQCHIIAAAMAFLNMDSLEDEPSTELIPDPTTAWMLPDNEQKKLQSVCEAIVTSFVIFKGNGRKNYSIEALVLLCQNRYLLSPQLASQLLWSRTVNVHGRAGKNIPGALHMEHLNRVAKECISHLGAGKTPKAISRVGKAIGTIAPVLDQFDINSIKKVSGTHKPPSHSKDMNVILKFLIQQKVFTHIPNRAHHSFPKPRNLQCTLQLPEVHTFIGILWFVQYVWEIMICANHACILN